MGLLHAQLAAEWKRALKFVLTVYTVGGSKCGPQLQPSSVKKRYVSSRHCLSALLVVMHCVFTLYQELDYMMLTV